MPEDRPGDQRAVVGHLDRPRQGCGVAWPEFAVLDGGIQKQADLFPGDLGVLENVLVKFWIGQFELEERQVAGERVGCAHGLGGAERIGQQRGQGAGVRCSCAGERLSELCGGLRGEREQQLAFGAEPLRDGWRGDAGFRGDVGEGQPGRADP